MRDFAGAPFRKMHTIDTGAHGERGIVRNEKNQAARPCDRAERARQSDAALLFTRAQDNQTAARKQASCGARVGHTIVVRHQHQRRQRTGVEPPGEPC
jgi:hypothetical protein